jgi:hypothetical protein
MKYRCTDCKHMFYANSIESIVRIGKLCTKCKAAHMAKRPQPTSISLSDVKIVPGKKTCQRCGVGNDLDVEYCSVCECVEFY